jgi:hypothetical protein
MIITTYLDESGTHAQSPISVMAGYAGTSAQWARLETDWTALARKAGVRHIHGVELSKRTGEFKGWKAEDANALIVSLDSVIAAHLQLGFAVIVRDDDYKSIYGTGPHPKRPQKDSKYGVCFRACLAFAPSYLASEFALANQDALAQETTINFVLEQGHKNAGDARRLFDIYKADALPEWKHFVGTLDVTTKDNPGAQAADFLAYAVYRAEIAEHGDAPSAIEKSSYVADTPLIPNVYPRPGMTLAGTGPVTQKGPVLYRIPISREVLQSLKDDLFAIEAERRAGKIAQ